jgi:CheY-like chemotaxis protein
MSDHGQRLILAVDHIHQLSKIISTSLTKYGFKVYAAKSPQEGLYIFERYQSEIDLVAVDIVTPIAGNLDLAAELERRRPGLPVLYLASSVRSIVRAGIEASSPESVLITPFTDEALLQRVLRLSTARPSNVQAPKLPAAELIPAA